MGRQGWALLLVLLLVQQISSNAQQMMPFAGNGEEPDVPTTVYVSSYIDRLMFIDDRNYQFEALVFVYLSWTDPRAKEAVAATRKKLAANSSASCKTQCQLYPQNQQNPVTGCCDDVWLPYVSFSTLKMLSQDRVMRWGVNVEPNSDAVGYWSIILGTFMASFDLRAFPFDVQRLQIQMEIPGWAGGNVRLQPSSGGTRMFNTNPDGDALSGWRVMAVRMSTYNLSLCQRYTPSSSQPSHASDPAPLVSQLLYTDPRVKAEPGACAAILDKRRSDPSFLVYTRQPLDGSKHQLNRPLNVTGVTCTIVIQRFVAQWVMSAILPIVASTWLGFVVFLLPRDCLSSRLGAVMTIFVAVAAIQFVVAQDLPNSSYMTALQQIIATGYVMLIVIALEAVIIWWITTYHLTGKRLKQHQEAQRNFEAGVKSELDALKAKLAAMLAEQGQSTSRRSFSRSLTNMRALSMARPKSGRMIRLDTARTAPGASIDKCADAAASAVAAADWSQQQHDASAGSRCGSSTPDAGSDVAGRRPDTDKLREAQAALDDVSKLQQQLNDQKQKQTLLRHQRQEPVSGIPMLGMTMSAAAQERSSGANHTAPAAPAKDAAAAADGAVLLDVGMDAPSHQMENANLPWCLPWRLCTRMRLYFAALQEDETLTDQLSYQLNKWVALVQFVAYNLSIVLIFIVNWVLYRKS